MLTTRELSQARTDVTETLVSTCRIERKTESVGTGRIVTETWGTAVASAACRIDPVKLRDNDGMVAGREASRARFQATFAWDVDLQEGDRVVFGSDTLELLELHGIHSDRIVTRATLAKIQGA